MKRLIPAALAIGMAFAPLSAFAQASLGTANQPMHPEHDKAPITRVDNHNGLTRHMRRHHRHHMMMHHHHHHLHRHM